MKRLLTLLLVIDLIIPIPILAAVVVYVDNTLAGNCVGNYSIVNRTCTGSDGDAFTTVLAAAANRLPGDTIRVRASATPYIGIDQNLSWPNGSAGNYITIEGYLTERPTIRYLDAADLGAYYWQIRNLIIDCGNLIDDPTDVGLRAFVNSIISNIEVTRCMGNGAITDLTDSQLLNLKVHANGFHTVTPGNPAGHGFYSSGGHTNIIDGGEYYGNAGQGIQCYTACGNSIIRNVKLYNNGTYGSFIGYDPNIIVHNVISYNNGSYGLWVNSGGGTISNVTTYGNGVAGIAIGSIQGQMTVRNSHSIDGIIDTDGFGYIGQNNITSGIAADHFIDALNGDFNLKPTSSAINAGMNVGLPFNDVAPDIGAMETLKLVGASTLDNNTIRIEFENNVNPPLINPIFGSFAVTENGSPEVETAAQIVSSKYVDLDISGTFLPSTTILLTGNSAAVTDSRGIKSLSFSNLSVQNTLIDNPPSDRICINTFVSVCNAVGVCSSGCQ